MGRQVNDVQKLTIYFAAGGSVFLVAMALGMRNVPFLVGAGASLLITVSAAIVVARRGAPPDPAAPTSPAATPQAPTPPAPTPPAPPRPGRPELHEKFTDPLVRTPPPRRPSEPTERANGHDPDGYDPADFETPRLAPSTALDPLDSEIEPIIGPEIPQARAEPTLRLPEGPAARGGTGLDAALPVADLARSLRFYQDILGFKVAYASADSAVVEAEGLRLGLDRIGDSARRAPRVGAVHVEVSDIEVACRTLSALGVAITEPPEAVGESTWRARLRDPDGHEVELLEYREA